MRTRNIWILIVIVVLILLGILFFSDKILQNIFNEPYQNYNLDNMNDKVETDINKLFVEDQRAVIYLPNRVAEIKQGEAYGVAYGIRNVLDTQKFSWQFKVVDEDLNNKCGVDNVKANSWIITGREGEVTLKNNEVHANIVRIKVPEGSISDVSTCIIKYELIVKKENGEIYDTQYFQVDIR
tara:strand:- start:45 stop:590 length:546 start_codon:yes stop_codon:yes gene_type:complete